MHSYSHYLKRNSYVQDYQECYHHPVTGWEVVGNNTRDGTILTQPCGIIQAEEVELDNNHKKLVFPD